MNILFVYGAEFEKGWGRSVKLAEALKGEGHHVEYLNVPTMKLSLSSNPDWVINNHIGLPIKKLPILKGLNNLIQWHIVLKNILKKCSWDIICWYSPIFPDFIPKVKELCPQSKMVYDIADHRSAYLLNQGDAEAAELIDCEELEICKLVDRISSCNSNHLNRLDMTKKGFIVQNGIEEQCIQSDRIESKKFSKAVYVGGINFRLDMKRLIDFAETNQILVDLYGPISHNFEMVEHELIQYRGEVPSHEVQSIIEQYDIGVLPYVNNEFNRSSQPLKILQYLSAGLTVIDFCELAKQYQLKGWVTPVNFNPYQMPKCTKTELMQYTWKRLSQKWVKLVCQ